MFELSESRVTETSVSNEQAKYSLGLVEQLDHGPIMFKLVHGDDGPKWSVAQVHIAQLWYKRFLYLNLKYPNSVIVPNKTIDQFWHKHILDTRKYAHDCDRVFGYFLHHFPYFGIRDSQDAQNLERSFSETKDLFLSEFGEPISVLSSIFNHTAPGVCQGSECGGTGPSSCQSGTGDGDSKISHSSVRASECMGTECGGTACGSTNKIGFDASTRPTLN